MDKIKAADPEIIVGGKANKPYYQIKYYDISDNEWHIGYGSYCLANVKEWLKTCFEVTNADVTPVKHGHWILTKRTKIVPTDQIEIKETFYYATNDNIKKAAFIKKKHITITKAKCSLCGYYGYDESDITPYCPNCGAKMDGDPNAENKA